MSIVAAVKQAISEGSDEFWALYLPEKRRDAYYSGCRELDRENKDESYDCLIMRAAFYARGKYGVRGLCFY